MRSLGICIHGEPGVGKTTLAATAPAYRLILDCGAETRFVPGLVRTYWRVGEENPPEPGTGRTSVTGELGPLNWDTCVVHVASYSTMKTVATWLESGQHPFRSLIIDSITELQKRLIDQVSGTNQPTQQDWGDVLRNLDDDVRKIRDLLVHPYRPLECVAITALTHFRDGRFRPFVKGQLELYLPGHLDVVGYLYVEPSPDGVLQRKLLVAPLGQFDAKDRTAAITAANGSVVIEPNLETLLQQIDQATN